MVTEAQQSPRPPPPPPAGPGSGRRPRTALRPPGEQNRRRAGRGHREGGGRRGEGGEAHKGRRSREWGGEEAHCGRGVGEVGGAGVGAAEAPRSGTQDTELAWGGSRLAGSLAGTLPNSGHSFPFKGSEVPTNKSKFSADPPGASFSCLVAGEDSSGRTGRGGGAEQPLPSRGWLFSARCPSPAVPCDPSPLSPLSAARSPLQPQPSVPAVPCGHRAH